MDLSLSSRLINDDDPSPPLHPDSIAPFAEDILNEFWNIMDIKMNENSNIDNTEELKKIESEYCGSSCCHGKCCGEECECQFVHHMICSLLGNVQEDHKSSLFDVKYLDEENEEGYYMACVGNNRVTIYLSQNSASFQVVQAYIDEDEDEEYYSCSWSEKPEWSNNIINNNNQNIKNTINNNNNMNNNIFLNNEKEYLLALGGVKGIIKIINCSKQIIECVLYGHGNSINKLKFHPVDSNLLVSASKDESIRLWNVQYCSCIAIFAGEKGHRDEILDIDIHKLGIGIVSCGMDTSIKIWNLEDEYIQNAIEASYTSPKPSAGKSRPPIHRQFPIFSSRKVHNDYIDSVKWVGDFLISKSIYSRILLWAPDKSRSADSIVVLQEFTYTGGDIWFLKFGISPCTRYLSVGNKMGDIFIWEIMGNKEKPMININHQSIGTSHAIRNITFSPNGNEIICCSDDGSLWKFAFFSPDFFNNLEI